MCKVGICLELKKKGQANKDLRNREGEHLETTLKLLYIRLWAAAEIKKHDINTLLLILLHHCVYGEEANHPELLEESH